MSRFVLAFDTSSDVTAVAVCRDGEVLAQQAARVPERHAQMLLPRVQACLQVAGVALADVELVCVGIGPGSFTGVRVGMATAKGLALGSGVKVCGVVSLAALARAVFDARAELKSVLVVPIVDAHKGEVFAALYACSADGELHAVLEPLHGKPSDAAARVASAAGGRQVVLVGAGHRLYAADMAAALPGAEVMPEGFDDPSAVAVAREGLRTYARVGAADVSTLVPMYLRDSDAQLPKTPLRL